MGCWAVKVGRLVKLVVMGLGRPGGVEGLGANEKRDGHLSRSPVQSVDNERGVLDRTSREERLKWYPKTLTTRNRTSSPEAGRGGKGGKYGGGGRGMMGVKRKREERKKRAR